MDWSPRSRLRSLLADDAWRYALVFGLASIPFTVGHYWQTGNEIHPGPVVLAALLAGYLAGTRPDTSKRVGIRTGLVAALPALWFPVDVWVFYAGADSALWFRLAASVVVALLIVLSFGIFAFIGIVGAKVGGWLAERTGRREDPPSAPV